MTPKESFSMKEVLLEIRADVKKHNEIVSRLEEQQRITNGRVGKSEDRIRLLEEYKWKLAGGMVLLGFAIPLIMKFFF